MHVNVPTADVAEGAGIFLGENPAALEAAINAYIGTLAPGSTTCWDADVTAVGGSRFYCVTLTLQDTTPTPSNANPSIFRAFLFQGEDAVRLLADRAYRYANDPNILGALLVFVDKLAGVSNGRHYVNLQIMGASD